MDKYDAKSVVSETLVPPQDIEYKSEQIFHGYKKSRLFQSASTVSIHLPNISRIHAKQPPQQALFLEAF